MKNLRLLFIAIAAVLVTFNVSIAQNYKSQFNVNSAGKVEDDKGTNLGWIEADGTIKNAKGEVVGKVVKKDKQAELLDKLGNKIGAAVEDGSFKDAKGTVVYTVSTADKDGKCKILDAKGKEVGTVHENYKQQGACIYHCLAEKKKK